MAFIDDLGESAIRTLNNIIFHLIGLLIKVVKGLRKLTEDLKKFEREKIFPIFEKKNIEFKDYTILKLQISSLGFLLFSVLYIFNILGQRKFMILGLITGVCSVYLIFWGIKEHFGEDYNAYRDFFLSYLSIAVALIVIKRIKPSVDYLFPHFHLVLASIIGVLAIDILFKMKYGRDYTVGLVIEGGSIIKVKVSYDICASIKPSIEIFNNHIKANKGDKVKLKVEKGFLNLRGSKVTEILGVVDG